MLRCVIGLLAILCLAGCEKHSGEAVVLAKDHIAASSNDNTPGTEHSASPNQSKSNDEQLSPMSDNQITVDGYVMKPQVRGTSRESARVEGRTVACKSSNEPLPVDLCRGL